MGSATSSPRILHLDDDSSDAALIQYHLKAKKVDCTLKWVSTEAEFKTELAGGGYDLVLSDYRMPGFNGDQALQFVRTTYPDLPFIMLTGELGEDRAIETLKRGATDYVLKGSLARLGPAIERALREAHSDSQRRRSEQEVLKLKDQLAQDLADMHRVYEMGQRLLREDGPESTLHQVLEACALLLGTSKGNVQLWDEEEGVLRIVTQVGFSKEFLDAFQKVPVGFGCVCALALERKERVIVENIFTDERFTALRPTFARHGLSACTSTPLFGRDGRIYGMLSNHFDQPHRPSKRELQLLDLYIQQAERVIELQQAR